MSRFWESGRGRFAAAGASFLFIAAIVASSGSLGTPASKGGPAAPGLVPGATTSGVTADGRPFKVVNAVALDVSRTLRSQRPVITPGEQEADEVEPEIPGRDLAPRKIQRDPVLQAAGTTAPTTVSTPLQNWEGVNNRNAVYPPDTNGDVGPNHYVQWVNLSMAIYSKTGTLLWGPSNGNVIFNGLKNADGTTSVCSSTNNGDPIVLYDQAADRWMISQFALPGGTQGYHTCIAVSQTSDPTGAWYRYDFLYDSVNMNDYPHFGVWPDGYYMSVNQFKGGSTWAGQGVAVFDRSAMLQGQAARMVKFDMVSNSQLGGMLPSDLDGASPPPAGAPNEFMQFDDDSWGYSPDQVQIWDFHVDWANTASSSFTKRAAISTAAFDSNQANIPQPNNAIALESLTDRLMYRMQYRNFGGYQTLVVNHTVDVDGTNHAGVRWYELRQVNGVWSIYQQGTFAPDANHRWMASAAMDGNGAIAMGYSVASSTVYPSIRYTGRLATDTLGTMPQGEGTIMAGTGVQTGTAARWGDYSMLAVDPTDDCTFWYTSEYIATSGGAPWQTRIASFKLPDCSSQPPTTGTLTGTVTNATTNAAIAGATVTLNNGTTTSTDSTGVYTFSGLAQGQYDVSATASGYQPSATFTVQVIAGSTTTQGFALTPVPTYTTGWFYAGTYGAAPGGDNNGYEGSGSSLTGAPNGAFATDANSGTGNAQTCPSTVRDAEVLGTYGITFAQPVTTVKGIEVQLAAKVSGTSGSPRLCAQLSWDGGTTWTAGKLTANLTKTVATLVVGSASDTWGRTWAGGDFGTGFRIRIVDLANSTKLTFSLDAVGVRVTYQ